MGEDSGHYTECAVRSYQTCLILEYAYMQITSDYGWQTPAPGQCCQVCELRTANQVAFYMRQNLLHATALPIDVLHLEMGLPVDSFTAKSPLSLCSWPRPNKQFHSTHTVLWLPNAPCWLNLKVTAYVQTPALHDTLAEKHVTKILKCFTISATPCSFCGILDYTPETWTPYMGKLCVLEHLHKIRCVFAFHGQLEASNTGQRRPGVW
jgi:hypothetical protein